MADAQLFETLRAEHKRHRDLLARIDAGDAGEDRASLFDTFRIEVTAHAAAEEETLYATMLADPELRNDAKHSVAEHKEIEDHLEELAELDVASDAWKEKFDELNHRYTHHIDEEEEDMFPAADEGISDSTLDTLGKRFDDRKPEEVARAEQGADADERE